jgi:transcriptional regulator with XRE-family HTH domain
MPSTAPHTSKDVATGLAALGARIRAHRKHQKVAATTAAEAAGMSRATLQRIERGEPSVTMGAYLSAIDALGLQFEVTEPGTPAGHAARTREAKLPAQIRLADYPQLQSLAWQLHGVKALEPAHALSLYERNWRHIDRNALRADERALIEALVMAHGGGRLLV